MNLILVDRNKDLCKEWKHVFSEFPEVIIINENILHVAKNILVSPANSYGFMDGGIDLDYANYFGPSIQQKSYDIISRLPNGMLPVGSSILIETGHDIVPYLIMAPTMEIPERAIDFNIADRAMWAALKCYDRNKLTGDIYCPGLGTGIGHIPYDIAAQKMANAYEDWKSKQNNKGK